MAKLTVVEYADNSELVQQKKTIEFMKKLANSLAHILTDDSYNLFSPAQNHIKTPSDSIGIARQIEKSTPELEILSPEEIHEQNWETEGYPLCKFQKEGRIDSNSEWFKLGEIVSRVAPKSSERERYKFIGLVEEKSPDDKTNGISR